LNGGQEARLSGLCCREIQKSLKESAKRLIEQKIEEYGSGICSTFRKRRSRRRATG
jgi:hypothetical protein